MRMLEVSSATIKQPFIKLENDIDL